MSDDAQLRRHLSQNDMNRTSTTAPSISTWCGEAVAEAAEITVGIAATGADELTAAEGAAATATTTGAAAAVAVVGLVAAALFGRSRYTLPERDSDGPTADVEVEAAELADGTTASLELAATGATADAGGATAVASFKAAAGNKADLDADR